MAIGSVVGFGNTAGTASNTAGSCTLPTITADGVAYLLVGSNVATTLTAPPAGWTLVDGPRDNSAGTQRAWLYSRSVTPADSFTTVSVTFAASSRWSLGGFVAPGGDGLGVVQYWADDTVDSTLSVEAITPTVDNAYRAILVQPRSNSAAYTVAPPAGWTELFEGIAGTAARWGVYTAGVQLVGQSGVTQPATSATYSGATARNIGWQFTVRPTPTSVNQDLAGTAPAVTGSSATFTSARPLVGSADAVSASTAAATVARPVAGPADAVTVTTGSMAVAHPISGSADASSASQATVTVAHPVSGTALASSTTAADATVARPLTATAPTVSGTSADPKVARPLAGTATASSGSAADLTTNAGPVNQALAGSATATTTTAGTFSVTRNTSGTESATSGSSGTLNASRGLNAVTTAASATSAGITVTYALTGNATATSDATGTVGVTLQLAGGTDAVSVTRGTLHTAATNDGHGVIRGGLTLAIPEGAVTIATDSALTLAAASAVLALTPAATLNLTVPATRLEITT